MRRQTGSKVFVLDIVKKFFAIFLFSAVLVGTGYAGLSSVQAAASPARIVAYQGRLLNSNGVPVSDTTLPMIFTLYTALSGGTCVWSNNSSSCTSPTSRTVSLTAGLFSENLGDTTASYAAINASVFSDNASIYLEIIVNGETLTPRKLMSASPYALNADALDGFDATQTGATSAMVPVFSSNGNLVITGAPQGTGVSQGSVYINPATATANHILFGVAVGGASRLTLDAEGDATFAGAVSASDFACTDCLDFAELSDSLVLDAATGINTNGFALSTTGVGALNFASSGQVTFAGNVDATNGLDVTGDLFVSEDIENDGNSVFGDTTGVDTFSFTSAATTGTVLHVVTDSLTSGGALVVTRADGPGAFDANLLTLIQSDVSDGHGDVASISNAAVDHSAALHVTQASTSAPTISDAAARAVLIDVQEVGSTDDAFVLRSDTTNGLGADVEFRITTQGDTFMDGVMTSASVAVGGADYAEFFQTTDSSLSGSELVCQDAANTVKRCEAGNTNVMGVISTNPGVMGNVFVEDYRDILANPGYRLVGMLGQIDVSVTAASGAIAVGDPITTSSVTAGYGSKAHGPVRILGFALESLSSGTGKIRVMVQPQWYGGDVLTKSGSATQVVGSFAIASTTAATASTVAVNSASLQLRGSAWDAGSAHEVSMSLQTSVNAINDYRLSVMNTSGTEVATVNGLGDLAIAGKFYPSDRGASQSSKYIYYDGSSGSGGDFMRTNASGWGTGSYDFAEMFPSPDSLVAGEVVVFGDASEQVKRADGEIYSPKIAGIVSTRPGFLAGTNTPGSVPIALAGRVPTLVSTENGPINIGDPVTTSSHPGYAMKATEAGPIVGYAAEAFSGSMGSIVVYVNVSYYSGAPVEEGPATANTISHLAEDIENFDTAGVLNLNGGRLLAIGSMTSSSGAWSLSETGDLMTSGRLVQLVRGNDGNTVETYATASRDMTIQLTGTTTLEHGAAEIHFADIDSSFTNIIDSNPSYRVLVTPYGATGTLYVTNRTIDGFSIAESGAASSGVSVDWMVIAYRNDYAPVSTSVVVPSATPSDVPTGSDASDSAGDAASSSESVDTSGTESTIDVSGDAAPATDSGSDAPVADASSSESVDSVSSESVDTSGTESTTDVSGDAVPAADSGSDAPVADASSSENAVSSDGATTSDSGSSAPESAPSSDAVAQ